MQQSSVVVEKGLLRERRKEERKLGGSQRPENALDLVPIWQVVIDTILRATTTGNDL